MKNVAIASLIVLAGVSSAVLADSRVRAVHASPDAPAVDVLVNDAPAFTSLAYTNASAYASVPAGTYNVKVVPAGLPAPVVIDANLNLADNTTYSVAAINTLANIQPLVLVDDNTLNPTNARIRFVHASPNAPAVDIALAGGSVLFPNVSFSNSGGYITVPGGSYDLEVRLAGTSTVVLPLPGVAVSNNTVYSVWAMGLVNSTATPLQAVVTVDAVPAPGAAAVVGMRVLCLTRRRR